MIVILSSIMPVSLAAQTSEVKRAINKFDVKSQISSVYSKRPELFWKCIEDNNENLKKIAKAYKSNKSSLVKTMEGMLSEMKIMQKTDRPVPGYDDLKRRLSSDLGIDKETSDHPILIMDDNTFNASMDPLGQMRINRGIINSLTYEELLAVCAHEAAHMFCEHVLDRCWKQEKKRRSNEAWATVGATLALGTIAASGVYGASVGYDGVSSNPLLQNPGLMFEAFEYDAMTATARFRFRYTRDQELEADILAYRFMEFMGYGVEHWLSALKKMQAYSGDYSTKTDKKSTHPSAMFRIQVISALMSGYSGKQK